MAEMLLALLLALAIDLAVGEPPEIIHPTVWFGKIIGFFDRIWERRGKIDFFAGMAFSVFVIAFAFLLSRIPDLLDPLGLILSAYLLKTTFSIRSLEEHVRNTAVEDISLQREMTAKIVSRNVENLERHELCSASIESLAENMVDAVISPLFYYLLFGLPGAMVYRAINTMDAMIGYKDERYHHFGKFVAKLDDMLNFIPARLAVIFFIPFNPKKVWNYYRKARYKINDKAIAMMSAVLGVKLEKKGVYSFEGRDPEVEDILRAIRVYRIVVLEFLIVVALIALKKI
ncbi:adenosylcobinamide-phosphate synthase [Archaeoglobus sulfaticallidus PM70-1]|uniref:Probable cobalamin biosynthesis protein CobD n=1 Tax=Archaeoglobus sulfaticallidus PM70-1 TaxID=387631 RepID=N0BEC3_9EURY|nr:adenosylcobinamide-phosphate synthase CbiB [Archaeoglobus sulfaticallidus]AGK60587.1 adenosylcobinamide-phosphate synthase [Archaeoglobus sulfaticallidus PM70-1]